MPLLVPAAASPLRLLLHLPLADSCLLSRGHGRHLLLLLILLLLLLLKHNCLTVRLAPGHRLLLVHVLLRLLSTGRSNVFLAVLS